MILVLLLACTHEAPTLPEIPPPMDTEVRLGEATVLLEDNSLRLEQIPWSVADRAGSGWRVRIPRNAHLRVLPSDAVVALPALTVSCDGPFAAINGGFYENGPLGLVVSGGQELHPLSKRGGSGVVFYGPEPIAIIHRDVWKPGAREALQSVDRIVDQGVSLVRLKDGEAQDEYVAARSALALTEDAVWLLAAAGDPSLQAVENGVRLSRTVGEGLTLAEFADLVVKATGAREALNLAAYKLPIRTRIIARD